MNQKKKIKMLFYILNFNTFLFCMENEDINVIPILNTTNLYNIAQYFYQDFDLKIPIYDNEFRTPLHNAVIENDLIKIKEIISFFNNRKKDAQLYVNIHDFWGYTAYHYALFQKNNTIISYIKIFFSPDIDSKNKNQLTALQNAIMNNKTNFVEILCENEASLHVLDKFNNNIFHLAVNSKSLEILKILIGHYMIKYCIKNALSENVNNNGETVLELACELSKIDYRYSNLEILIKQTLACCKEKKSRFGMNNNKKSTLDLSNISDFQEKNQSDNNVNKIQKNPSLIDIDELTDKNGNFINPYFSGLEQIQEKYPEYDSDIVIFHSQESAGSPIFQDENYLSNLKRQRVYKELPDLNIN